MKTNQLLIALAIFAALLIDGCAPRTRVGALRTKSQSVELGDADPVNVEIQMGAGKLDVSGGATELLEASFTYNVEDLDPRAIHTNGRLEVMDSGVNMGIASFADLDDFRNEWDLKLNEDVPMEMKIDLGAGPSNLALGALALTSLNINGGAGEIIIDLSGTWRNDLDARITGGLGDLYLTLPREIGVRIEVDPGVGIVDASSLKRNGNTYTNYVYGVSGVTLRIHIEGGVGNINLGIE